MNFARILVVILALTAMFSAAPFTIGQEKPQDAPKDAVPAALNLTGSWKGDWKSSIAEGDVRIEIIHDSSKASGTIFMRGGGFGSGLSSPLQGSVEGNVLEFWARYPACTLYSELRLEGSQPDFMKGAFRCQKGANPMEVRREK